MKNSFTQYHPIIIFFYFLFITIITMFINNPIILSISLLSSILFYITIRSFYCFVKDMLFYIPLFLLIAITNPLFSHNGVTPLFFLNGKKITKEAVLCGMNIAVMLIAIIFWSKCFMEIFSSDKVLYIFSKIGTKFALVLSMSIRFLPLFKREWKELREVQIAIGYYSKKGFFNKIKSELRVFSALFSCVLESAIDTSTSMKARGYAKKEKRTNFSLFILSKKDFWFLFYYSFFLILTLIGIIFKFFQFYFYPKLTHFSFDYLHVIFLLSFFCLTIYPFFYELKELFRWKLLISKI